MSNEYPETPRGWLLTLLALAREGGPVSLLIAMVSGALIAYVLIGEMRTLHAEKDAIYQQLLAEHKAHLALAATCAPSK
jgi:hypothetical protein